MNRYKTNYKCTEL